MHIGQRIGEVQLFDIVMWTSPSMFCCGQKIAFRKMLYNAEIVLDPRVAPRLESAVSYMRDEVYSGAEAGGMSCSEYISSDRLRQR